MQSLGIGEDLLRRRPAEVSCGQLQRIALVRALLLDPALLFAVEPTSRLDLLTQQETMRCVLDQVVERGCALLLVTHDPALADATTDRRLGLGWPRPRSASLETADPPDGVGADHERQGGGQDDESSDGQGSPGVPASQPATTQPLTTTE